MEDVEKLFKQLQQDEGIEYSIYKDHLGFLTYGIGHLITEDDDEYGKPEGTPIPEEKVYEAFEKDLGTSINECKILFEDDLWEEFPAEVQEVCINMMFNLGRPRFSKFKKTLGHLKAHRWAEAALEARDSKWYRQVTNRAERLCRRLEGV
tara:strand:- start:1371 stop:1820 length:450 start_codon:yes stop_codon:yes gene_type:complete